MRGLIRGLASLQPLPERVSNPKQPISEVFKKARLEIIVPWSANLYRSSGPKFDCVIDLFL